MLLNKGASVNAKAKDGSTALTWAVSMGHDNVAKLLRNQGAVELGAKEEARLKAARSSLKGLLGECESELTLPCGVRSYSDRDSLLKEPGADVTLSMAAGKGDLEEVRRLIEAGADVNEKTSNGWTPLMKASLQGHVDVVKLPLEKGAKIGAERYRRSRLTALSYAIAGGDLPTIKALIDH
jgi:ankyrin repeat protein